MITTINLLLKKIKNTSIAILLVVTLFSSLIVVTPSVSANSAIMVYSYVLDPPEVTPGYDTILTLTVVNTVMMSIETVTDGSSGAMFNPVTGMWEIPEGSYVQSQTEHTAKIEDIYIKSFSSYLKPSGNFANIGELAPGGSFTISFQIHTEENATEGLYFPEVYVDVKEGSDVHFPIPVRIVKETVELLPSDIPSKISISGITESTLTVVNKLGCPLKNVMMDISGDEGLDFSPERLFIGLMDAYSSRDVIYSLKPSSVGKKNISFICFFKNSDKTQNKSLNISIDVVDICDVELIFQDMPSVLSRGDSYEIDLEVYNSKSSSISGVTIVPISDASVYPSKYFIGEMDPDDIFSAHFVLKTDTSEYGDHTIGFKVIFKQENDFYETSTVTVDYSVNGDSLELGALFSSIPMLLIYCVIIIIALSLFFHLHGSKRLVKIWSRMKSAR